MWSDPAHVAVLHHHVHQEVVAIKERVSQQSRDKRREAGYPRLGFATSARLRLRGGG